MIYEMRIYNILPGRLDAIRKRFAEHTLGIFARLGMEVCDFWEDTEGQSKLIYVMKYESMEERTRLWAEFANDPAWIEAKRNSELDGKIVESAEQIFMKRAEYFKG